MRCDAKATWDWPGRLATEPELGMRCDGGSAAMRSRVLRLATEPELGMRWDMTRAGNGA
jgi:hypothetical protein